MKCDICGIEMQPFERAQILGKYDVQYYRCPSCGFVCTERPYWMDEAYSDAICDADIGLMGRNVRLQSVVDAILRICLPGMKTFLDYGGVWRTRAPLARQGFSVRVV